MNAAPSHAFVIDTHSLIYWLLEPDTLSQKIRRIICQARNIFYVPTMVTLEVQY